jgi:hypothetical protein
MTRIRSLIPSTSGSSDEIIMLGADVDSPGRLVEENHFTLGFEPLGEDDLLLISAGKVAGWFFLMRKFDAKALDVLVERAALLALADEAEG